MRFRTTLSRYFPFFFSFFLFFFLLPSFPLLFCGACLAFFSLKTQRRFWRQRRVFFFATARPFSLFFFLFFSLAKGTGEGARAMKTRQGQRLAANEGHSERAPQSFCERGERKTRAARPFVWSIPFAIQRAALYKLSNTGFKRAVPGPRKRKKDETKRRDSGVGLVVCTAAFIETPFPLFFFPCHTV